jgi:class 3 adenylate cyclase
MTARSLSVQSKLLIAFTLLTVTAIGLVSWAAYTSARASLTTSVERQLVGLQHAKAGIVRTMLTAARNQVLSLAATDLASSQAKAVLTAYRQLDGVTVTPDMQDAVRRFYQEEFEPALAKHTRTQPIPGTYLPTTPRGWYLHYHYLVNGGRPYGEDRGLVSPSDRSPYAAALATARAALGPSVDRLRFGNVLLVDPASLEVFFSYDQSSVIGTSLEDGPYAGSNVAALVRALRTSQDPDDYRVGDFEAWRPSLGLPKAFVVAPVFDGPTLVAVMVVRFPIDGIENALTNNRGWEAEGFGKTGEAYLLGPDQTMRTTSRFLLQDRAGFLERLRTSKLTTRNVEEIERLDTTILTLPVKHEAARRALNGQSGIMEIDDYRGVPVLMAYGPLDMDSLRWGVIAKIEKAEALAPLRDLARRILALGVALSLLAGLAALGLAALITRPIAALVRGARQVSQGALDVRVDVAPQDEFRELGEAFNEMVRNLRESRQALHSQVQENERLLLSLLPASGAAQVRGGTDAPRLFTDVTVAYARLTGFDTLSRELGEDQSMGLLSDIVAAFDEAAEHHGVEKVRTIGASYLAASGLSVDRPDHTARMVEFARELVRIVKRFNAERGTALSAEVGINTGPVVGGLVGRRKFIYDLWGDTVKLARGIETGGAASILVTRAVYDRVRELVPFGAPRQLDIQGVGLVELYPVSEDAA